MADGLEGAVHVPEEPHRTLWDVVIVGTGMGGSVLGRALARPGRRVLFLEKGLLQDPRRLDRSNRMYSQARAEPDRRVAQGHWPLPLRGETTFGERTFFAPLGCGAGGSTAIYTGALERFHPIDFTPRANFPDVPASTLPERWPVSYDELAPYYARAEALFRLRGTPDPLSRGGACRLLQPPPLGPRDQSLYDSWVGLGLHPYRVHVGFEFVPGCDECSGTLCPMSCKGDAKRIGLDPAIESGGAMVLPECEVTHLEAGADSVERVHFRRGGQSGSVDARIVVLAAGAWMSPLILLRSRSDAWPNGLGNRWGMVGRNLTLHASDFFAVQPLEPTPAGPGPRKALGLNDLYVHEGRKLGTVQSAGGDFTRADLLAYSRAQLEKNGRPWRRAVRPLLPVLSRARWPRLEGSVLFTTIMEDPTYHENRVVLDTRAPNGMRFRYRYTPELRERSVFMRRELERVLAPHRVTFVTGGNNLNFGHPSGTCRAGDDPESSVLDRDNRAHGVTNLYVVDASFFPSGAGINPSLTIAANALRVAEVIERRIA